MSYTSTVATGDGVAVSAPTVCHITNLVSLRHAIHKMVDGKVVIRTKLGAPLRARARAVLLFLASISDFKGRATTASKETIAERTGLGAATVYRALADLEDAGLIRRFGQRRHVDQATGNSYYTTAPVLLTKVFFQQLLVANEVGADDRGVVSELPEFVPSSQSINLRGSITSLSSTRETTVTAAPSAATVADGKAEKLTDGNFCIPAKPEFKKLVELGLTLGDVVALMAAARKGQKRLEDVALVIRERLEALRGQREALMRYLRAVLASDNFTFGLQAKAVRGMMARKMPTDPVEAREFRKAKLAKQVGRQFFVPDEFEHAGKSVVLQCQQGTYALVGEHDASLVIPLHTRKGGAMVDWVCGVRKAKAMPAIEVPVLASMPVQIVAEGDEPVDGVVEVNGSPVLRVMRPSLMSALSEMMAQGAERLQARQQAMQIRGAMKDLAKAIGV